MKHFTTRCTAQPGPQALEPYAVLEASGIETLSPGGRLLGVALRPLWIIRSTDGSVFDWAEEDDLEHRAYALIEATNTQGANHEHTS